MVKKSLLSRPRLIPTGMICSNDFDRQQWLLCGSGVATSGSDHHRSKLIMAPDETTQASNYRLRTKKIPAVSIKWSF